MRNKKESTCSLEQELAEKAKALESLRQARVRMLAGLVLKHIEEGVVSKENDILKAMSGKNASPQAVREIVVREILRSADGLLWCGEYVERARSDQHVSVFTGSHWEEIEPQQWKDFVGGCAERCGVPGSQLINQAFMKPLYEGVAFNLAAFRRRMVPDGEVWLNVMNGTLVVKRDGEVILREHRKDDLFTYTLPYAYDPKAECEQWERFLNRVLPEQESRQVLAEFCGYCFMSGHELEMMLWLYGEGLNGKSVTLEIIEALLGTQNVSYLSLSDLTNDEVKRAGIEHKMLNISHESGRDVNANVLKQLTSGEKVLIKRLYQDPRQTVDYGKFIAAFNELPRAENTFGYFRRLIILPYSVTIPKEDIDRQLASRLKDELPGILNWVLSALPGLMSRGEFTVSPNCEKAKEYYRLQSDSVRLFVNEMCIPSDETTRASEINTAYRNYCYASSLKPLGKQRFYDRLEKLGFEKKSYANIPYFRLKLTEP